MFHNALKRWRTTCTTNETRSNTTSPRRNFAATGRLATASRSGAISSFVSCGRNTNTEIAVARIASPYQARSVERYGRGEGNTRKRNAGTRSSRATTTYTTLNAATDNQKLMGFLLCNRGCTLTPMQPRLQPESSTGIVDRDEPRPAPVGAARVPDAARAFDAANRGLAQAPAARCRSDRRRIGGGAGLGEQPRTDGMGRQRHSRRRRRGAALDGETELGEAGARAGGSVESRGLRGIPHDRRRDRGGRASHRARRQTPT